MQSSLIFQKFPLEFLSWKSWFLKLIINRLANNFIKILFWIKYNDITNAFKAYKKETLDSCYPIISQHFNINAELSLKSIIRRFKYKVIPISWTNRKEGTSKFQIKEMRNRYFFIIFYIFLEKLLMKEDILNMSLTKK